MRLTNISSLAAVTAALIIAACGSSQKHTTAMAKDPAVPVAPPPVSTNTIPTEPPPPAVKPSSGIVPPTNAELAAIQGRYPDVTMQTLIDGHKLYTGVCTNCHPAKSIYSRPEEMWPGLIDDMAMRSKLTNAQKDAVYKYVLAIKATQPKEANLQQR